MHSEQESEEGRGRPTAVVKDNKTKTIVAKAVPSKRVKNYTVEVVKNGGVFRSQEDYHEER